MNYIAQIAKTAVLAFVLTFSFQASAQEFDGIAETYVRLAHQMYSDSLVRAQSMADEVEQFLAEPTDANLSAAKQAWREARAIYSQTEVFRFAHPIVDEWEPQVNAWPLDEGFIDYVDGDMYFFELGNPVGQANIIASEELRWGPNELDLSELTPELLSSLNELGGTEANVATGWHAIEFLLWGQDLNGTGPGAGERPASDYARGDACTHGNCDRRRDYLSAATALLIQDLEFIVDVWDPDAEDSYGREFLSFGQREQLQRILYGMGSLALGELAGERMKVALFANSTEDEHDCFSDDTHNTLYNNARGIDRVLRGNYQSESGATVTGPSLLDWAEANAPQLAAEINQSSTAALAAAGMLVSSAEDGQRFDQLIAPGNSRGAQIINGAIESLKVHTRNIELLAEAMELGTLNPDNAGHQF